MAYLEITLKIAAANRGAAIAVYERYRGPFLEAVKGAKSKDLLVRDEDVQVLIGFGSAADANAYLESSFFSVDVVGELKPLLNAAPDVRIYDVV